MQLHYRAEGCDRRPGDTEDALLPQLLPPRHQLYLDLCGKTLLHPCDSGFLSDSTIAALMHDIYSVCRCWCVFACCLSVFAVPRVRLDAQSVDGPVSGV